MEERRCSGKNIGILESTKQAHTCLCIVLKWENCNEQYNSFTLTKKDAQRILLFSVSRGDTYEESFALATIPEP